MSSAVEILKAARELISSPERWTQGTYARDETGKKADLVSPSVVCRCSIGAIAVVAKTNLGNPLPFSVKEAFAKCGVKNCLELVRFNDNHSHSEVLALFDQAIERASAQQYKMCGGCGATHPRQRCIGCLHYFGGDSWDTRTIYENFESGANAAANSPAPEVSEAPPTRKTITTEGESHD